MRWSIIDIIKYVLENNITIFNFLKITIKKQETKKKIAYNLKM